MIFLFQQFPTFSIFQHLHLLNCNLIEFDKPFALRHSIINQYSIDVLHIREANQFIDSSVVTDIPFEVGIGLSPLFNEKGTLRIPFFVSVNQRLAFLTH